MTLNKISDRAQGIYQRVVSKALYRGPVRMQNTAPLISFTFDDFPRTALCAGGAILRKYGFHGTYYAALGLMGKQAPVGEIFRSEDLGQLLADGHELGSHTFGHCHSWNTAPGDFERSIVENNRRLQELAPGGSFRTLSYPITDPRPLTKRLVAKHFTCCRAGGQTFNSGVSDRYLLRAYFLEKSKHDPESVKKIIDLNVQQGGWLIFATHDVSDAPTRFGCTPAFFDDIVRHASRSGAQVSPVGEAWEIVCGLQSQLR